MNLIKSIKSYTLYIIVLTIVLLLSSCNKFESNYKLIISKSHLSITSTELPKNICRYFYKTHTYGIAITFSDECDKYNVGDTIVGIVRIHH